MAATRARSPRTEVVGGPHDGAFWNRNAFGPTALIEIVAGPATWILKDPGPLTNVLASPLPPRFHVYRLNLWRGVYQYRYQGVQ